MVSSWLCYLFSLLSSFFAVFLTAFAVLYYRQRSTFVTPPVSTAFQCIESSLHFSHSFLRRRSSTQSLHHRQCLPQFKAIHQTLQHSAHHDAHHNGQQNPHRLPPLHHSLLPNRRPSPRLPPHHDFRPLITTNDRHRGPQPDIRSLSYDRFVFLSTICTSPFSIPIFDDSKVNELKRL